MRAAALDRQLEDRQCPRDRDQGLRAIRADIAVDAAANVRNELFVEEWRLRIVDWETPSSAAATQIVPTARQPPDRVRLIGTQVLKLLPYGSIKAAFGRGRPRAARFARRVDAIADALLADHGPAVPRSSSSAQAGRREAALRPRSRSSRRPLLIALLALALGSCRSPWNLGTWVNAVAILAGADELRFGVEWSSATPSRGCETMSSCSAAPRTRATRYEAVLGDFARCGIDAESRAAWYDAKSRVPCKWSAFSAGRG